MKIDFFRNLKHILSQEKIIEFLYEHLDQFRDSKQDIRKCMNYTFSKEDNKDGFILCALDKDKLCGVLVMIETGMSGYIPEYFLVYIAVDARLRGKGIGSKLIKKALKHVEGDVALHVEYDNPAKKLYEELGFKNKYAEMRYRNKD